MKRGKLRLLLGAGIFGGIFFAPDANATNALEFPDNGSEQLGRGGAWMVRASDPLATIYNPAGLVGQVTALSLSSNFNLQRTCFQRFRSPQDGNDVASTANADGLFPEVCGAENFFPNPQIAATFRLSDRVGLGLAVAGPSAVGHQRWPDVVANGNTLVPSPQRYLLSESRMLLVTPTLALGVQVAPWLKLGLGLGFGIFRGKFSNASMGINQDGLDPRDNDVKATVIASDSFVPSFTLGAIATLTSEWELGATLKWSDSIRAIGDIYTQAGYYRDKARQGDGSGVYDGDSSLPDCGTGATTTEGANACGAGNNASLRIALPMEAKIGLRMHRFRNPRMVRNGDGSLSLRSGPNDASVLLVKLPPYDPMRDDLFDVEFNLTWTQNSVMENLELRFPATPSGDGRIPVNGTPGNVPPNADVPLRFRDVLGLRVGGDYNVLENKVAVRAGAFMETSPTRAEFQNIGFAGGSRAGLAFGATFRVPSFVRLGEGGGNIDLSIGFAHVFLADTTHRGDTGLYALAGTACNPVSADAGDLCPSGRVKYRSNAPVNLGTIRSNINVLNVGATLRF